MNTLCATLVAGAVACAASPLLAAPTPLLSYGFDGAATPGGSLAGSAPSLGLVGPAAFGAPGTGVTGLGGDGALNLTAAGTMGGAPPTGGRAQHSADFDALDTLTSFTLAGWFKTDGTTPIGNNAGLITNSNSATTGFSLRGGPNVNDGTLTLKIGNSTSTSTAAFGATQEWVFFAVSYDGTAVQPNTNVRFYAGSTLAAATAAGTGVSITGPVANDSQALVFGSGTPAFGLNVFAFDGFLDNLHIYGEVLSPGEIERVRASTVPAPGAGLALLSLSALGLRRHR